MTGQPIVVELDRLAILLHLESRAREAADLAVLGFVLVNETHALAAYRQAVLWTGSGGVTAVSGAAAPESGAPFVLWLNGLCAGFADRFSAPTVLGPADAPVPDRRDWEEWLPPHGLWLPLTGASARQGALLLVRDEPWSPGEITLLGHLAGAYAHAWAALRRASPRERLRDLLGGRRRWRALAIPAVLLGVLTAPVRLSVLAPAEIVPADPAVVRAPLDGVIDRLLVRPNEEVAEGQPLFDLDRTALEAKTEVAVKALATAEAEYRQTAQQAVWDAKSKAQLAAAAGRVEERRTELGYLQGLLERIRVKAPRAGVAVFGDPSEWIGRPVTIGERVMLVSGERESEVEAWLAPADAIPLASEAEVTVFLNADPLAPVRASLRQIAYEAQARPDGSLAYRLRAAIRPAQAIPRIGLKGVARLDGGRTSLAYWLSRKPLAILRQSLGL